jgi:hypothetical protein
MASYVRTFCGEDGALHEDAKTILKELRRFCQVGKFGLVHSPIQRMTDIHATVYRNGLTDVYKHIEAILKYDIGVIDNDRPSYADR